MLLGYYNFAMVDNHVFIVAIAPITMDNKVMVTMAYPAVIGQQPIVTG
jgi:hypothetical protein